MYIYMYFFFLTETQKQKKIEDLETIWLSFIFLLSLRIIVPGFLSLEYHLLPNLTDSCLSICYVSKLSEVFEFVLSGTFTNLPHNT